MTLTSMDNNQVEVIQNHYVDHPPIPSDFYVQKIRTENGDVVVLHAKLKHDLEMPEVFSLFSGNGNTEQLFIDNGVYPDLRKGDGMYASVTNQPAADFLNEMVVREARLLNQGFVYSFTGHSGEIVEFGPRDGFERNRFDNFELVELSFAFLEGGNSCDENEDQIKKRNSLLITDKEVVEDPSRTYNVVTGNGAPQGAWTFGTLMKNIAGGIDPVNQNNDIAKVRDFLKEWILELGSQNTNNGVASSTILAKNVWEAIPYQWLKKSGFIPVGQSYSNESQDDWVALWDEIDNMEDLNLLLANAPFKLTAIVNRLDLRGNTAGYGGGNSSNLNGQPIAGVAPKAGETRFIFSLVQIIPEDILGNFDTDVGKALFHDDAGQINSQRIDWQGLNVILEYDNMEFTACDVRQLGMDWKELSNYNLDDLVTDLPLFLDKLELITNKVTARNANIWGVNGSAISQVRTNTKLFAAPGGSASGFLKWGIMDWSLRQFELNGTTGFLKSSPVTNNPLASNNSRKNTQSNYPEYDGSSEDIVNWIYGVNGPSRINSVLAGNYNLPNNLIDPSARMVDEEQSYYDLGFYDESFPSDYYSSGGSSEQAKNIRHQLSLNSCMGCHGAETKTMFNMIRPLGYGEEADYWSEYPSTTTGIIRHIFNGSDNAGDTKDIVHKDKDVFDNIPNYEQSYYISPSANAVRTIPNVSPFLTGRNYRGTQEPDDRTWDDDFEPESDIDLDEDIVSVINDRKIQGTFSVNDPSNDIYGYVFPGYDNRKNGFNELENRQLDLCQLISLPCGGGPALTVINLAGQLNFIPLPTNSH